MPPRTSPLPAVARTGVPLALTSVAAPSLTMVGTPLSSTVA